MKVLESIFFEGSSCYANIYQLEQEAGLRWSYLHLEGIPTQFYQDEPLPADTLETCRTNIQLAHALAHRQLEDTWHIEVEQKGPWNMTYTLQEKKTNQKGGATLV